MCSGLFMKNAANVQAFLFVCSGYQLYVFYGTAEKHKLKMALQIDCVTI